MSVVKTALSSSKLVVEAKSEDKRNSVAVTFLRTKEGKLLMSHNIIKPGFYIFSISTRERLYGVGARERSTEK